MKASLAFCLCVLILSKTVFCLKVADVTPVVAEDPLVPVTTNSVSLRRPFCYFNREAPECDPESACDVWLVSSLSSATSAYDQYKFPDFHAPYPEAYTSTGNNFSTLFINSLDKIPCPSAPPYGILVGKGPCTEPFCNGLLPVGQNMSFKYLLIHNNTIASESNWSNNVTLKSVKNISTLDNAYAGRSASMVVITAILATAMALLLLLLLIGLILFCCFRRKTTGAYETTRLQPTQIGSLRVPSYDVHNLKHPSPYDNPAYEANLKKRYTTNNTLPQTTTTVVTHVQSPDNIIMQRI